MVAALLSVTATAAAQDISLPWKAGDVYEITRTAETTHKTSDGSSGNTHDTDIIRERVIAVRDGGVELEYDLPNANAEDRAANWQFPVRVFRSPGEAPRLLNASELDARVDKWLKAAGYTREACGRWIFTWNAFRIECDPQSVLKVLEAFDLQPAQPHTGDAYSDPQAREPAVLTQSSAGQRGSTFVAKLEVDPQAVRRARAESDVAVAQLMGQPVTPDAALQKHAAETIAGTITVTLDTDATGAAWRRKRAAIVRTTQADGVTATDTATEVLERRPVKAAR